MNRVERARVDEIQAFIRNRPASDEEVEILFDYIDQLEQDAEELSLQVSDSKTYLERLTAKIGECEDAIGDAQTALHAVCGARDDLAETVNAAVGTAA